MEGGKIANSVLPELIAPVTWLNQVTGQSITRADRPTLLRLLERMRSNLVSRSCVEEWHLASRRRSR